jgi:hypothetical protein
LVGLKVSRGDVSVNAHRTAVPNCRQCGLPHLSCQLRVDHPLHCRDRLACLGVVGLQWAARKKLCGPGGGPSVGSISASMPGSEPAPPRPRKGRRCARRWRASHRATGTRINSTDSPRPALPSPREQGSAVASAAQARGASGALFGPARRNDRRWAGAPTNSSGPRRKVRLSQPFGSAAVIGRPDQCGNCLRTSRPTSVASISRSKRSEQLDTT